MFKNIGIENFRVFKDFTELEIAPITVLTGPNNSGKSSLIKLLSLLKNSFGDENGINTLIFEGGRHNLGTFNKILSWDNNSGLIKIILDFPLIFFDEKFKLELVYNKINENGDLISFKVFNNKRVLIWFFYNYLENEFDIVDTEQDDFFYSVDLEYIKNTIKNYESSGRKNSLFFDYYIIENKERKSLNNEYFELFEIFENKFSNYFHYFDPQNVTEGKFTIFTDYIEMVLKINQDKFSGYFWPNKSKGSDEYNSMFYQLANTFFGEIIDKYDDLSKFDETKARVFTEFIRISSKLNIEIKKEFKVHINKYLRDNVNKGIDKLIYTINSFEHLTVNRGSQKRILSNKSQNAIDEVIREYYFVDDIVSGKSFLEKSFQILNIKGELIIKREEGVLSKVYIENDRGKTNLSDLGFGYSQLIPILLKIITLSNLKENEWYEDSPYDVEDLKNETVNKEGIIFDLDGYSEKLIEVEKLTKYPILIIEEPESNLHPNLQSKLADVLVLAYKMFGIHFILETHSEYLIRKLQLLTARNDLEPEKYVNIYYFNADEYVSDKEPKVKKIQIDEYGALTDSFGPGFFDEATSLKFELIKLNQAQKN